MAGRWLGYLAVGAAAIAGWELASASFDNERLFPSPSTTLEAGVRLLSDGALVADAAVSWGRIMAGFVIGTGIGFLLGLLMGISPVVRALADPYVHVLRFISGIAWIGLATLWLGLGEGAKIALIAYVSVFPVALNTMAGYQAIPVNRIRAARSMGAGSRQVFWEVAVPSTAPYSLQGMRLAMSVAFLTVVAAEMFAATSGVGYLIWSSRQFFTLDEMFVGIVALGLMGVLTDRGLLLLRYRFLGRFEAIAR